MFASMESSAEFEDRIVDGAGQQAAALCSWLLELGELDASDRGPAAEWASTAAWLSWSCAIQAHLAKEYVEVARRLPHLPRIREEFSKGRLSYSQVRLLVRVASETTEETLVYIARNSSVGQLGLVVGRYRSMLEAEQSAQERHQGRYLHTWFDQDGYFVLRGRLTPEDGAIVEASLRKAAESIEMPEDALDHFGARQADALVQMVQTVGGDAACSCRRWWCTSTWKL